jgi:hypothetical protein
MSKSRQTLLGRFTFSALVAGSLTFGGVQVLAGASTSARDPYVCKTRPQDSGCAAHCLAHYPLNGGAHFCGGAVPGGYNCICAE